MPLTLRFSRGHQHRSAGVRPQDCSSQAPVPAVGAIEAAHTLAWPSLCCTHPQNLQLLCADATQPQEHKLFVKMFHGCWIYKAGSGVVNLQLVQPQGKISALLPKLHNPWISAVISFSPLCMDNHWHLLPEPPRWWLEQPEPAQMGGDWGKGQAVQACLCGSLS